MIAILILASSFRSLEGESFFDFRTTKEINRELVESRFQLTNSVDISSLKEALAENKNIKSINMLSERDNYFQIRYTKDLSLNKLRSTFLLLNTDFDLKSINVLDKKYYSN